MPNRSRRPLGSRRTARRPVTLSPTRSKGDIKRGNIEVGEGVGGFAAGVGAGALVSFLLFGVATGGVGLVVIGVAAAGAGYWVGEVGKWGGEKVAQQFNELTQP